jgi:4-hydroxy-3-methylbut-2-enyl diphosphate reductase IspH
MSYFYFFKKDKKCKWMENEITNLYPKILHDPVDINDINKTGGLKLINGFTGKIKFFVILDWVYGKNRGTNLEWLNESGCNYVKSIKDLPQNSGIYITGYDSNICEIENAKISGIPIIDHACPWVRYLKKQILSVKNDEQAVLLIDKGHMVYNCYKDIFPDNIIIISPDNYKEEIRNNYKNKPLKLMSYAVYRIKEVERIIDYINEYFPHKKNNLTGYKKTICCWIKQGLLEEIEEKVKEQKLDTILMICSSTGDRSTMSVMNEINESGAKCIPVKNIEDVPEYYAHDSRIGVLVAPIPLSKNILKIIDLIKENIKISESKCQNSLKIR